MRLAKVWGKKEIYGQTYGKGRQAGRHGQREIFRMLSVRSCDLRSILLNTPVSPPALESPKIAEEDVTTKRRPLL